MYVTVAYEDQFGPVSRGLECVRRQMTDLKEHVVGCHGELARVEHQAFSEQGEEAMTQHDLSFPPGQDIRRSKGQSVNNSTCQTIVSSESNAGPLLNWNMLHRSDLISMH